MLKRRPDDLLGVEAEAVLVETMRAWKRAGLTMIAAMRMGYLMNKITGRGDESERQTQQHDKAEAKLARPPEGLCTLRDRVK